MKLMTTAALALILGAAVARAQEPQPAQAPQPGQEPQGPRPTRAPRAERPGMPGRGPEGPGGMEGDPLERNLFPPEVIMHSQEAIGLSDEQRNYMIGEVQRTQAAVAGTQWRLQSAVERLGTLVRMEQPDEAQVLTQLDNVLALEKEMKRAQIGLLVRLKAHLTTEQQNRLRQRMGPMGSPPREE